MTEPTFGMTFIVDNSDPFPTVGSDMSVVGYVLDSDDADAAVFPLDTAVEFNSTDPVYLAGAGTGPLYRALIKLNAQLAPFQAGARMAVVRVAKGADTAATITNIVGSPAAGTGWYAMLQAGQRLGVIPRLLASPGYTGVFTRNAQDIAQANPICAVLPAIANAMLAVAYVGGPGTTKQDALDWRETITSDRVIPHDGWDLVAGVDAEGDPVTLEEDGIAAVIGQQLAADFETGGIPLYAPANRPVQGIIGLKRYDSFSLTDGATDGQILLAAGIGITQRGERGMETAISDSGFTVICTDTASDNPLWRDLTVRRMRDYEHLGLLKATRRRLGRTKITKKGIESVINDHIVFLSDLEQKGGILPGWRVGFEASRNNPENLRLGKIRTFYKAEESATLRHVTVDSRRSRESLDILIEDLVSSTDRLLGAAA
jgi:phage tail sheath protein FI